MVERMIGVEVRHRRVERLDVPPQPAAAALLPVAVGAALELASPIRLPRRPGKTGRPADESSCGTSVGPCQRRRSRCGQGRADRQGDRAWPRQGKGTGGPPHDQVAELLRAYYRHVAPEDLVDRSDVDIYGAFASHYKLAANRPQGTAQVRGHTPTLAEHGWSASGHTRGRGRRRRHAVPRRLADHGAVPAAARRARRHPPQLRRGARHHRRAAVGELRSRTAPSSPRARRSASRGCTSRSTGCPRATTPTAIVDDIQRVLRDVREAVEDWRKMHAEVDDDRRRPAQRPAAARPRGGAPGRRAARVAGRRALHLPRLPRVQARAARRRRLPARDPRHRPRHPARRPGDVGVVRPAARAGQGEGAREDPARAGQGQLPRDRAPAGVPRLRRREDVRRRTARSNGERRFLGLLVERGLHRVADADPADPGEGRRRSSSAAASTRAATPARR